MPLLMFALACFGSACDEDKPYTPFEVASSLPGQGPAPKTKKSDEKDKDPERVWAAEKRAPRSSSTFRAFKRSLLAPSGTEFEVALPLLNSQSDEVAAWVFPKSGREGAGADAGLWVFDASGQPTRKLLALPEFLPSGTDCEFRANLKGTGPTTFSSRVWATCGSRLLPGTPVVSLAVLDGSKPEAVLLHLRAEEPAVGEKLDLEVESTDQDGDGTDDVKLQVSMTTPSGTKETLPFLWLQRTAGASRQADLPKDELNKRASRLSIASVRKAEREATPAQIDALRRLLSSVCAELGKPRLTGASGDLLKCGNIQSALEQLAQAEVQAFLGQGKKEDAIGATERSEWFGTAFDAGKLKKLKALVQKELSPKKAERMARFNVRTKTLAKPFASPLHFSKDGQLFAKVGELTKRLTMEGDPPLVVPATETEPEKRVEPPEWTISLQDGRGLTPEAALPSCDRSEVILVLGGGEAGSAPTQLPLPFLAPRPGTCRAFAPTPLDAVPLRSEAGALTLVVGGQRVTSAGRLRPDDHPDAWGTSLGVVVVRKENVSVLTGEAAEGLHHCVTNRDASKVACLCKESVCVLKGPS